MDFERLTQLLADAHGVDAWVERLRALPGGEGVRLSVALLRIYRHGALWPARWQTLTGRSPAAAWEIDDSIRRFWDASAEAGLSARSTIQAVGDNGEMIRRWAWQPRWSLLEQDEDLMLMSDSLMPELLAIAGTPQVPKRDYILAIVAHHARDRCSSAVMRGEKVCEVFELVAAWAPAARAAGAETLAGYLDRLGGYARASSVDHEVAVQRLLDIASCFAPPPEALTVVVVPGGWEGPVLNSARDVRVRIDAKTGAMSRVTRNSGPRRGRR